MADVLDIEEGGEAEFEIDEEGDRMTFILIPTKITLFDLL